MVNGKIKSIPKRLTGLFKMVHLTITRANTFISMFKNGKTKQVGGVLLSKVT
jgi:hypothetical protein